MVVEMGGWMEAIPKNMLVGVTARWYNSVA